MDRPKTPRSRSRKTPDAAAATEVPDSTAAPSTEAAAPSAAAPEAPLPKPEVPVAEATSPVATIIIPVYNEQGLLETAVVDLIGKLRPLGFPFEVILSENGSKDDTKELAFGLERRFPEVKALVSSEPNYGRALRRGILEARGTYVLCDEIDICDVDFHTRALAILRGGQADMVVGSKAHAGAHDKRPAFRRLGTKVINTLLRVFLDFRGTDTHGLKAFHRERLLGIVNRCIVDRDLFASEFVIRAERADFRVVEIPVEIAEKRPPSINLTRRVPKVLKDLTRLFIAIRIRG
jgi:glycosyltransferase involved in cell wall biosynthesis